MTKMLGKTVNGCYTRMLRTALNVHRQQQITNKELYGSLPRVCETIRMRRLRLASHCAPHNEETTGSPSSIYEDLYCTMLCKSRNISSVDHGR